MSSTVSAPEATSAAPDPAALFRFLDGDHHDIKEEVRQRLADFGVAPTPVSNCPRDEYRAQVPSGWSSWPRPGGRRCWVPRVVRRPGRPRRGDRGVRDARATATCRCSSSAACSSGCSAARCCTSARERHHEATWRRSSTARAARLLRDDRAGHGSNVQPVETTATYDAGRRGVRDPHARRGARKDYIGNAARDGRMAVGVRAARCRRRRARRARAARADPRRRRERAAGRHDRGRGDKLGLNGVDNGRISFDHVRVPREALLDRYADVAEDGPTPARSRTRTAASSR